MLQSNQKRQTFRLSIRNRQIQQKFSQIRRQYQQLEQKSPTPNYNSNPLYNHHPHIDPNLDNQYLTPIQIQQKNNAKNMIQQVLISMIKKQKQIHYNTDILQIIHTNINSMCTRLQKQPAYKTILLIALNDILQKSGQIIVQAVKNLREVDAGSDDQQQQRQYYVQQQQDHQYRTLCQTNNNKLSTIHKQTHYNTNNNNIQYNHHNITFSMDNHTKQQYKYSYDMHLQLFHKIISIISRLQIQRLPLQSCMHMIQILWDSYQQLPIPNTKLHSTLTPTIIKQKYLHHLYLQTLYKILTIFFNFLTNHNHIQHNSSSNSNSKKCQFYRDMFLSIGLYDRLRYVIDYVVQCKVFLISTGQCVNVLTNNFVLLNLTIIELILQYQNTSQLSINKQHTDNTNNNNNDQKIQKLDQNLHQYFASYCLYILNQYQNIILVFLSHGNLQCSAQQLLTSIRLYQQTLQTLITILTNNEYIIGYLSVQKYANLLNVIHMYTQKWNNYHTIVQNNYQLMGQVWKSQGYECIVYLILNILELVSQNCQKSTKQLITNYKLLDILQQFLTLIYNSTNHHHIHNPINTNINNKTMEQYIGKLSKTLSNILYTSNKRTKQILYSHPIYQSIMDYLTNVNNIYPFIKLIDIFVSYFVNLGSKVTNKYMHRFVDIVTRLDLRDQFRDSVKHIRKIIATVYENCKCYIKQQQMDRIRNMYIISGLEQFINDQQQLQMCL